MKCNTQGHDMDSAGGPTNYFNRIAVIANPTQPVTLRVEHIEIALPKMHAVASDREGAPSV